MRFFGTWRKNKEFCSIFKKHPETKNVIDATRRPVIVAAADLPIRALRNENGWKIIDSLERIPNAEKIYGFRFSLISYWI